MIYLDEKRVRELVEEAVAEARNSSRENRCDDAVVQCVLKERFVNGRWRSSYFIEDPKEIFNPYPNDMDKDEP